MSDTPRTDFVSHTCEHVGWSEQYDRIKAHARLLEIELTEEHDQHRARQTECVRLVQELDEARAALREMLSMLEWKNVNYEKAIRWERAAGIDADLRAVRGEQIRSTRWFGGGIMKTVSIEEALLPINAALYGERFDPPHQMVHACECGTPGEICVSEELYDAMRQHFAANRSAFDAANAGAVRTDGPQRDSGTHKPFVGPED